MNVKAWLLAIASIFVLVGCSEKNESDASSPDEILEKNTVGFEISNGEVEAAENVPEQERTAILAAFNEYIEAFNAQDIERYMNTLSKNEKGFNLQEERKAAETAFATYEIERVADDVTITKFEENSANIFATLSINLVEKETGAELTSVGRQVTVLAKEQGDWKIASIYYIGNE